MPLPFPIQVFGGENQNDQEDLLINKAYSVAQAGYIQQRPLESPDAQNIDFTQRGIRKRKGSAQYKNFTTSGASPLSIMTTSSSDAVIAGIQWVDPATGSEIEVVVSKKTIYTDQSGTFATVNRASGGTYAHNSDVSKVTFAEADGHLFIGLDGASNYIQVYRSGSDLDDHLSANLAYSDVDQDSASGAAILYVSSTDEYTVGGKVVIDQGFLNEETGYISSITDGVALTLVDNLENTHISQVWTVVTNPDNVRLKGVTWGDGLYVAVGEDDATTYAKAYITTSPEAVTWTARDNPDNKNLNDVVYADGKYVAVGIAPATTFTKAYIATSADAITWTAVDNPSNVTLNSVTWGNSLYVAVGEATGSGAYIATSPDAITWTSRNNPDNKRLSGVAYGNGIYVAVGQIDSTTYTKAYIATSTDGITWTARNNPDNSNLQDVVYGNGTFVAVGSSASSTYTKAYIITSTDGLTWTVQDNPDNITLQSVTYGDGLFMAVGDADASTFPGSAYIITSVDGVTWIAKDNTDNSALYGAGWGNGIFVAVGSSSATFSKAYLLTAPRPVYVNTENYYTEAFDTSTTHIITGSWDKATYLIEEFQGRLMMSTGNTLITYTPEAFTSGSGIWDMLGSTAGFLQVSGNIRTMTGFSPAMSDSLKQALYIGTDAGFEITTGFSTSDILIRIEGAKSPLNHQTIAKSLNWFVYLTDDQNIMGINGSSVIDLGRRLKSFGAEVNPLSSPSRTRLDSIGVQFLDNLKG